MLSVSSSPIRPCLAMEFPDLGAHCSEPSCQRLGEGRSGGGAGPGGERLGAVGGAKGELWDLEMPERGGARSWGGVKGGVAKNSALGPWRFVANRVAFFLSGRLSDRERRRGPAGPAI